MKKKIKIKPANKKAAGRKHGGGRHEGGKPAIIPWRLTGTMAQQAIVSDAFSKIHFPFGKLGVGNPELGWRDLNGQRGFRHHSDVNRVHEEVVEPLNGDLEGRRWVMGVFYPGTGKIYLDVRLEKYPKVAHAVVSAEIAHAVDEFLPLNNAQRGEIISLLHPEGPDHHTWWERHDYSAEYYSLVGEEFMRLFTEAYSDIPFGNSSSFVHGAVKVDPAKIREVIGVGRTDKPTPKPAPKDPPKDEPAPAPELKPSRFKQFPGGENPDIYHKRSHYGPGRGETLNTFEGYRPCKVCKPPGPPK